MLSQVKRLKAAPQYLSLPEGRQAIQVCNTSQASAQHMCSPGYAGNAAGGSEVCVGSPSRGGHSGGCGGAVLGPRPLGDLEPPAEGRRAVIMSAPPPASWASGRAGCSAASMSGL